MRTNGKKELTRYVPLLDEDGVVRDVSDILYFAVANASTWESIEIYGMGFVGLTLGVALAARGHNVTGIDTNTDLVKQLRDGKPHVFEPRLADMLNKAIEDENITFVNSPVSDHSRIVIISVGTPVNKDGSASLSSLDSVTRVVGARLKRGSSNAPLHCSCRNYTRYCKRQS